MPRLQRPLDPKAVAKADAELAKETGGRKLTMDPKDAALRKKWVAAYLAAGGKEAKNFNAKPAKKAVQICPKTNWIEVEYLYADNRVLNDKSKGVKGAVCIVTTPDGAELARATTDQNGFARIDGLPNDVTSVNYWFDKDPPKYEVYEEYKSKKGITWEDVKDVAKWIGGALAGDFNEDQSIGQIVVGTVITLIPVVDQIGDVRDIVAALKKLVFDKRYDEAGVWFDLVITLIGCIPEIGTVIKGVLKTIKKSEKGIKLAELLSKLNWVGKGNAVKWLKKLSGDLITHGKTAAAKIKRILDGISSKLETAKKVATAKIASKIDEILDSIKEVRKRVDDKVNEIINDLKKLLDDILAESSEKIEKKGNTQKKNTLKQEKTPLDKVSKSFELDPEKYKYFFGKIEPPLESLKATDPEKYKKLKHNYDRSQQLKKVFESMGIKDDPAGREKLIELFEKGTKSPELAKHVGDHGTTITRAIEENGVRLEVKYFYPNGDMSAVPKVVTVIPKVLK